MINVDEHGKTMNGYNRIRIVEYQPSFCSEVESFLCSQAGASPYHYPVWSDIYHAIFGHQPKHLVALDHDGKIAGFFPCLLIRWPVKRLVSFPHRDRGGPVAVDEKIEKLLINHVLQDAAKAESVRYVKLRAIGTRSEKSWKDMGGIISSPRVTMVKSLPAPNQDIRETGIDDSLKRALRIAEESGLTFEDVSQEHNAWIAFYSMFLKTRRRLGAPSYPWPFFSALSRMAVPAGISRLFMVKKDARPCAAMIVMLTKYTAIYAYGASDRETWSLRPNDFLMWKVLQWCADRAIAKFDFGADQREQESLIRFKAKWNGVCEQAMEAVWPLKGKPPASMRSSTQNFLSRIHRHLPIWALRTEGSLIFRILD
jgi:hypothetical protein